MLIFNTTYKVPNVVNELWINWISEQHIPFMLQSGSFSKSQVAKIVGSAYLKYVSTGDAMHTKVKTNDGNK